MFYEKKNINISGTILSGGKNSRMGQNKAFIEINGITIIERTINIFKEIFDEIIISTNSLQNFKLYENDVIIIPDIIKNFGPLSGIHSALSKTTKESVFFIACDMPFIQKDIILQIINCFNETICDCVVPKIGDSIEPLCAIYKKKINNDLQNFLKNTNNYAIKNFLKTIDVHYLDLENNFFSRKLFINLNAPSDLDKIK
ncbi:MAG: molybdenum cofactor guanylyltransferase [bacterium]